MSQETVYIKIAQITEVYKPDVFLKDIAEVHCSDRIAEAKVKAIKVASFSNMSNKRHPEGENSNKKETVQIGSVVDLLKKIEEAVPGAQVDNLGETDYVIRYQPKAGGSPIVQWMKTACVAVISFCGAAFAIMTFNNDANVTDVFANIYYLTMGVESDGVTILEFSYSLGIAVGILVFFNHFAKWKLTVDPTPIEVEMRLYEENLNKALIQNHGRKEKEIDVS